MKNSIERTATDDKPEIRFNESSNTLTIVGNSYPENCSVIYEPIKKFIENLDLQKKLTVSFYFNLLNSTSSVYVAQVVILIAEKSQDGLATEIDWKYDEHDEEMLDLGQKLASISKLDINFISVKD